MKKSIFTTLKTVLISTAALFVLLSCNNIAQRTEDTVAVSAGAKTNVTFTIATALRTALPTVTLSEYTYTLTGKKDGASSAQTLCAHAAYDAISAEIETGTWEFTIIGYKNEAPVLQATKTVSVSHETTAIHIKLAAATGGTGQVSVTLTYPANLLVTKVNAALYDTIESAKTDTGTELQSSDAAKEGFKTVTFAADEIPSGVTKYLAFYLYNGSKKVAEYTDAVYAVAGLSSTDEYTIADKTFTATVQVQKNGEAWVDSGLIVSVGDYEAKAANGTAKYVVNVPVGEYDVFVNGETTTKRITTSEKEATLQYLVPTLFPAQNATDAFADTQLILTFGGEPTLLADGKVTISSADTLVDSISASASKDEVQHTQSGYCVNVGNQQLVRVDGTRVYIQPRYNGTTSATVLQPQTEYTVHLEQVIAIPTDYDGLLFDDGTTEWTFKTKAAPAARQTLTVNNATTSNTADYFSVYGAMFAAAQNKTGTYEIQIAPGMYYELISIATKGANTILKGTGNAARGADTVIEYVNNQYLSALLVADENYRGQNQRASFYFAGGNLTLENVALKNLTARKTVYATTGKYFDDTITYNDSQIAKEGAYQAEALNFNSGSGKVLTAYNSSFSSLQDTLLTTGKVWFYDCALSGDVDFIWGTSDVALFEKCDLTCVNTSATSAYLFETRVGSTSADTVGKGYVLYNTTVTVEDGVTAYFARRASQKTSATKTYDQAALINVAVNGSGTVAPAHWIGESDAHGDYTPNGLTSTKNGDYADVGWKEYNVSGTETSSYAYAATLNDTNAFITQEYSGRRAILNRVYNKSEKAYEKDTKAYFAVDTLIAERSYVVTDDTSKELLDNETEAVVTTWDWRSANLVTYYADSALTTSASEINAKVGTVYAKGDSDAVYATVISTSNTGKLAYTASGYAQCNTDTEIRVPVSVGSKVTIVSYPGQYHYTVAGTAATGDETTYIATKAGYVPIVATSMSYLYYISVTNVNTTDTFTKDVTADTETTDDDTISATTLWKVEDYWSSDSDVSISSSTTQGKVAVLASSDKPVTISKNSKTIDSASFTHVLKFVGSASSSATTPTARALQFALSGAASIKVYAVTASSGTARDLMLTDGTTALGTKSVNEAAVYEYAVSSAGTYYLYSNNSGINIYGIYFDFDASSTGASAVSVSGNSSVTAGSSITLTATVTGTPTTASYAWTITDGTSYASFANTAGTTTITTDTNTVTLYGIAAGSVAVTVKVDEATSEAKEITVRSVTAKVISLTDTPTGYAGVGTLSYKTSGVTPVTINATDSDAIGKLKNAVKNGNAIVYINGMIDATYNSTYGGSMLPSSYTDSSEDSPLGKFIAAKTSNTYKSWDAWRLAYAAACDVTSHKTTGTYTDKNTYASGKNETLDGYQTALASAWKSQIQIPVGANTTIIGLNKNSGIKGGNISISTASNIIIRNLHFKDAFDPFPLHEYKDGWNAEYDCITIQGTNDHIWIDHCTFEDTISVGWKNFAGVKTGSQETTISNYPANESGTATGYEMWQTYDGLCDIKGKSTYITISYCVFKNHDKTMLLGSDDDEKVNNVVLDDTAKTITLSHNYFDSCVQRLPFVRTAHVHIYDNYFGYSGTNGYDQKASIQVRAKAWVLSEYNYFGTGIAYRYKGDSATNSKGYTANTKLYDASTNAGVSATSNVYWTAVTSAPFTPPYTPEYTATANLETALTSNAGVGKWTVEQ